MTTFTTGRQAEAVAATYLEKLGFTILEQNYRTRWCEIDIVAEKANELYFVEVKYRQNAKQGSGLEYITGSKLNQMMRAAEFWVAERQDSRQYYLAGIEVSGTDFQVTDFIESLT
jgi:uncharacterized protein (TIGR00252 family)